MSESLEMYLVMTALLRRDPQQPVPVSLLASRLAVTPVSANEMCHKLSERGLVDYQPYKGVTLTTAGEALAQEVLSRRRLWVVFLVENLGIEPQEADELACQLEHITSDRLVSALRSFLEHTPLHSASQPSFAVTATASSRATEAGPALVSAGKPAPALSTCSAGTRGRIAVISAEPMIARFLYSQGLQINVSIEVLAVGGDGTVLVGLTGQPGQQVALAATVAAQIEIAPSSEEPAPRPGTWARCSAFWACIQGHQQSCSCQPQLEVHEEA